MVPEISQSSQHTRNSGPFSVLLRDFVFGTHPKIRYTLQNVVLTIFFQGVGKKG
jgi:hypothetical protein